jgi:ribosomal protein S18 acetylase RimI-like enzyme
MTDVAYRRGLDGLAATWRALRRFPGAQVLELEGAVAVASGLPHPIANQALVLADTPAETFTDLQDFFERAGVPYALQIVDEVRERLEPAARAAGFAPAGELPFMVCDPIPSSGPAPALEIALVHDQDSYDEIARILEAAFDIPASIAPAFVNAELEAAGAMAYFLGRIGGRAVCTSSGFLGDGVVGIYCVGTLADARRHGAGARITRAAIDAGVARGADLAFLQSSKLGYRVYEGLGFRPVGTSTLYVPPAAPRP